jgi:hypothetical protein
VRKRTRGLSEPEVRVSLPDDRRSLWPVCSFAFLPASPAPKPKPLSQTKPNKK